MIAVDWLRCGSALPIQRTGQRTEGDTDDQTRAGAAGEAAG